MGSHPLEIPGYSREELEHHIEYLYEEGLNLSKEGPQCTLPALTVYV